MNNREDGQWRWPLPDDWEPVGYWCVQITIPGDQQYFDRLTGALGLLTLSKSWYPDATRLGPAAVAQAWETALYLNNFSISTTCNPMSSPPIPDTAAADDAAAAIFTVFMAHIVAEMNSCAALPGDCADCVDSIMTDLSPYGASDAVRGELGGLCADLTNNPGTRAEFEAQCPYFDQFNDLRAKIADNPSDWLNHLSDWAFGWLNQTSSSIYEHLNTIVGLMGFGVQRYITDHGGIPGGGGAGFGGDCTVTHVWDFTTGLHDWVIQGIPEGYYADAGVWVSGVGIQGTNTGIVGDGFARIVHAVLTFPATYTGLRCTCHYTHSRGSFDVDRFSVLSPIGGPYTTDFAPTIPDGSSTMDCGAFNAPITGISVILWAGNMNASDPGGYLALDQITMTFPGSVDPFA